VDDDETVIINLCSEGRHHDMVDIFTANDVFWIVGKDGFICQFGDEPWGCPEGSDEINPVLFEIYNVVVKHN